MADSPRQGLRERLGGRSPLEVIGLLGPAIAMLWAGVALAGNVIAAGAKFTTDVERTDLLQVGVAQFTWIGYTEALIAVVWVLGMWPRRRSRIVWMLAIPVVLFLIQEFVVYPALHERTDAIIAGQDVGDSPLHVIYAALEGAKILLLVTIGLVGSIVHSARPRQSDPAT